MEKQSIKRLIKKHIKLFLLNKKHCSRSTKSKYSLIISELYFILEDLEQSKLKAKNNLIKRINFYKKNLKGVSLSTYSRRKQIITELKFVLSKF